MTEERKHSLCKTGADSSVPPSLCGAAAEYTDDNTVIMLSDPTKKHNTVPPSLCSITPPHHSGFVSLRLPLHEQRPTSPAASPPPAGTLAAQVVQPVCVPSLSLSSLFFFYCSNGCGVEFHGTRAAQATCVSNRVTGVHNVVALAATHLDPDTFEQK